MTDVLPSSCAHRTAEKVVEPRTERDIIKTYFVWRDVLFYVFPFIAIPERRESRGLTRESVAATAFAW